MADRLVKAWIIAAALAVFLLAAGKSLAVPPIAAEIYGNISLNNVPVQLNTLVLAYDNQDILCGRFTIVYPGRFGLLSCNGDDPSTTADEGAQPNERIRFYANNTQAIVFNETQENSTWNEANFRYVRLRILHCGDRFCDIPENCSTCSNDCGICKFCGNGVCEPETGETCETCAQDCGLCPIPGQEEPGGAGTGGGAGAGQGSAGGGAGGDSGAGAGAASEQYGETANEMANIYLAETQCTESWQCSEWTKCNPAGLQYRECADENKCETTKDKPTVQQACQYTATCDDRIQNCHIMPDGSTSCEEGVDCGGPCSKCASCNDGIQNQGEKGIDCGGPCTPCASCNDNRQNCHRMTSGLECEQGTDCGGPCAPCREKPAVQERPAFTGCGDGICTGEEKCTCPSDCNKFQTGLFLLGLSIVALIATMQITYLVRGRHTRKIIKIIYLQKLGKTLSYSFLAAACFSVIMLYDYWFCQCKENCTRYAYMPIILITLIAATISYFKHRTSHRENQGLKRMMRLSKQHETLLMKVSQRETQLIAESEETAAQGIKKILGEERLAPDAVIALEQLQQKTEEVALLRLNLMKTSVQDLIAPQKIRELEKEMAELIPKIREMLKKSGKTGIVDSQLAKIQEIYSKADES